MIQIDKNIVVVPAILAVGGNGEKETNKILADFDNGQLAFSFNTKIYGHKSVKASLKELQHSKCCFCETKIDDNYGDIEHFRPKAGYQTESNTPLIKPGYYWLAYDFDNLFFSCIFCNQLHKKNHFPLANEAKRAKSHYDDIAQEDSLLLHPAQDKIDEHITFAAEIAKPRNDSSKGQATIDIAGLNRRELLEARLDLLKKLRLIEGIAKGGKLIAQEAQELFKSAGKSSGIFSAMVRANFPDLV